LRAIEDLGGILRRFCEFRDPPSETWELDNVAKKRNGKQSGSVVVGPCG
jgi:hypothetical protein